MPKVCPHRLVSAKMSTDLLFANGRVEQFAWLKEIKGVIFNHNGMVGWCNDWLCCQR